MRRLWKGLDLHGCASRDAERHVHNDASGNDDEDRVPLHCLAAAVDSDGYGYPYQYDKGGNDDADDDDDVPQMDDHNDDLENDLEDDEKGETRSPTFQYPSQHLLHQMMVMMLMLWTKRWRLRGWSKGRRSQRDKEGEDGDDDDDGTGPDGGSGGDTSGAHIDDEDNDNDHDHEQDDEVPFLFASTPPPKDGTRRNGSPTKVDSSSSIYSSSSNNRGAKYRPLPSDTILTSSPATTSTSSNTSTGGRSREDGRRDDSVVVDLGPKLTRLSQVSSMDDEDASIPHNNIAPNEVEVELVDGDNYDGTQRHSLPVSGVTSVLDDPSMAMAGGSRNVDRVGLAAATLRTTGSSATSLVDSCYQSGSQKSGSQKTVPKRNVSMSTSSTGPGRNELPDCLSEINVTTSSSSSISNHSGTFAPSTLSSLLLASSQTIRLGTQQQQRERGEGRHHSRRKAGVRNAFRRRHRRKDGDVSKGGVGSIGSIGGVDDTDDADADASTSLLNDHHNDSDNKKIDKDNTDDDDDEEDEDEDDDEGYDSFSDVSSLTSMGTMTNASFMVDYNPKVYLPLMMIGAGRGKIDDDGNSQFSAGNFSRMSSLSQQKRAKMIRTVRTAVRFSVHVRRNYKRGSNKKMYLPVQEEGLDETSTTTDQDSRNREMPSIESKQGSDRTQGSTAPWPLSEHATTNHMMPRYRSPTSNKQQDHIIVMLMDPRQCLFEFVSLDCSMTVENILTTPPPPTVLTSKTTMISVAEVLARLPTRHVSDFRLRFQRYVGFTHFDGNGLFDGDILDVEKLAQDEHAKVPIPATAASSSSSSPPPLPVESISITLVGNSPPSYGSTNNTLPEDSQCFQDSDGMPPPPLDDNNQHGLLPYLPPPLVVAIPLHYTAPQMDIFARTLLENPEVVQSLEDLRQTL